MSIWILMLTILLSLFYPKIVHPSLTQFHEYCVEKKKHSTPVHKTSPQSLSKNNSQPITKLQNIYSIYIQTHKHKQAKKIVHCFWANLALNMTTYQLVTTMMMLIMVIRISRCWRWLGAVHKWRHHFWGVSRPPLPLVIMSSFGYPPPFVRVNGEKNWSATKQRTPGRWWIFSQLSCSFNALCVYPHWKAALRNFG